MEKERFLQQVRTVGIIGAGRSGLALSKLARSFGKDVFLSDQAECNPEVDQALRTLSVQVEWRGHSEEFLEQCDFVLLSPGVSLSGNAAQFLRKKKIPFTGELEFASWFCPAPIIAITGSNGKTTTTFLISEVLKLTGKKIYTLGNIGTPLAEYICHLKTEDLVCLEVSSFQLETVRYFHAHIGCFLNITENHLDRHKDMAEYFAAKRNIFLNQGQSDYALFLPEYTPYFADLQSRTILVHQQGLLNINFAFAFEVGKIYGVSETLMRDFFDNFKGLPHRMERVRILRGVEFINDSKSTNVTSTLWALANTPKQVILIAGGRDKNLDYAPLNQYQDKIKNLILIGEAQEKIKRSFLVQEKCIQAPSLLRAVEDAFQRALPGECVLLSPMCASFDMFRNYEERGDVFRQYVAELG